MTGLILLSIGIIAVILYALLRKNSTEPVATQSQPSHFDLMNKEGNPLKRQPQLLDLKTTTVAERQRAYGHGYREQLRYDELQRRAEAAGDTATLEAIRLGTYNGPLPELENNNSPLSISSNIVVIGGGDSDASVQELNYFCIKNKGYHVSVWPRNQPIGGIVEFSIAGISFCDNIKHYLGEFCGTLEPEPTNSYDANAIKILAPDGHHLGYVPKNMTTQIRRHTTLPCSCFCYIGSNNGKYFSTCYIVAK